MVNHDSFHTHAIEEARRLPVENWTADLITRTGFAFDVRPVEPSDEASLAMFFTHVDKEDLRFRFLSAIQTIGHRQLEALVTVDHRRTEDFLAIKPGNNRIIASAMLAADDTNTSAEVALAVSDDCKHRGISWTLLDHVARFALAKGIKSLESIESRDNIDAITLERERGWTACPGDAALVILRKTLDEPAI